MKRLVIEGWFLLLYIDWLMRFREFKELHSLVRDQPVSDSQRVVPSEVVCRAMDLACVLYFKRVLCLQRSAAATLLLRRYGWSAEMVIGAQLMPFKSHAWCEINGVIVNDKPYMHEMYQVLERC